MVNQLRYLGIVVSKKMQKTATIVVKRPYIVIIYFQSLPSENACRYKY